MSYNGGGNDWSASVQTQLLDSVGTATTVSSISGTACATGQQSPINVVDAAGITPSAVYDSTLPALSFSYPSIATYKVEMNGASLARSPVCCVRVRVRACVRAWSTPAG